MDLFVAMYGPDVLWRNDGGGRFVTDTFMRTAQPGLLAAGTVRSGAAGRAAASAAVGCLPRPTSDPGGPAVLNPSISVLTLGH